MHTTHENCGASQALCTPIMKSPRVSGFERCTHENCGASQAVCSPMMKIADSLRLCQPQFTKSVGRLRLFAPHREVAYSLRLWARSVLATRQNCGTSQALCSPMMKIADSLRLCAPPFTKIGGRLRLLAPPMMKIANSLRLGALSSLGVQAA